MYALLAILDLLFLLFAVVFVNWWAAWFASADGWLPRWLSWFQTFDATLDSGWKDNYPGYTMPTSALTRWWQRTRWLYRNPAYGFSYWALGRAFDETQWRVVVWERNPSFELFIAYGQGMFNVTYYGQQGRLKLGWKAWNYFDAETAKWKPGYVWGPEKRVPLVASYTPFRRKNAG
jgi:hypothetical protein